MNTGEPLRLPSLPLKEVYLANGFERHDGAYGATIKIQDPVGLVHAVLTAVVLKEGRLSGEEITYLREKLDLLQSALATLLGVENQTISLWERGSHRIPRSCDTVLRGLVTETIFAKRKSKFQFPLALLAALSKREGSARYVASITDGAWVVTTSLNYATYVAGLSSVTTLLAQPESGSHVLSNARTAVAMQEVTVKAPLRVRTSGAETKAKIRILEDYRSVKKMRSTAKLGISSKAKSYGKKIYANQIATS